MVDRCLQRLHTGLEMNYKKEIGGLFETRRAKGRIVYRVFAATVLFGICIIWFYRLTHVPTTCATRRWAWIGLLAAELWFGMYWILTQASRWNLTYRRTFKDRLSHRYESDLPGVDVFVCTADPTIEPPLMVVNTVISVMAYDYSPEKLSVYLSDDAGSDITYFALLEASHFAKHWIPFCNQFRIEPRSPAAYFGSSQFGSTSNSTHLFAIKKLYEDMKHRIESACKLGRVPDEIRSIHEGFAQWDSYSSSPDHNAIVQILIDQEELKSSDINGNPMPTLVYMAREKRPDYFHNFKAGAMNALIRVSSMISNGEIILNVDCDMYSNNSEAIRDALCFFMDEQRGHQFAYVQFPQNFDNVTKNELYSSSLRVISEVEFHGLDGYEGPMYIGSGCFHRREVLCGKEFNGETKDSLLTTRKRRTGEDSCQVKHHHDTNKLNSLASCTFEKNTQWGTEIGLRYGVPVEDFMTGLMIQCKGWKSVYYNPERKAFLGVGATTLLQSLVMHKRWSEGDLQIFFSKLSPITHGLGRLSPGLLMGYLTYCLWAPNCFATLYYVLVPSICLWKRISLFPEVSSPWFLPFAYVIVGKYSYSLAEFLMSGGTVLGWWNDQRMWLYKRTSSYLFASIDTIVKLLGFSDTAFVISPKVTDDNVSIRYEKELMEFGDQSPMLTIITTVALLNLACLVGFVIRTAKTTTIVAVSVSSVEARSGSMFLQGVLCLVLVLINLPIYRGVFFRKDGGKMHVSTGVTAIVAVVSICSFFFFL